MKINKLFTLNSKAAGFTIVELLIVILVIGILATIVTLNYSGYLHRAAETQVKTDLTSAASKLKTAAVDGDVYPSSGGAANLSAAGFVGSSSVTITPLVVSSPDTSFCLKGTSTKYSDIILYMNDTAVEPTTTSCP